MDIKFSLFEVLLFIGILQGLIVSGLIWYKERKKPDKLLLSFILIVFNLLCIKIILLSSGLWKTTWLRYFPLPFDLAIQPLLLFYIASLTSTGFKVSKKLLLHFIPFALSLAYSLFIYFNTLQYADLAKKDSLANHFLFNPVKEVEDFLSLCSAIIYWYFSLKYILRYRMWLYNTTSNTLLPTYGWLRNVIVLFGVFFLILGVNIVLDYGFAYGVNHFSHWQIFFVYLALLIYYLGFRGYQISGIAPSAISLEVPALRTPQTNENSKQKEGSIKSKVAEDILKMLSEEKLYLDPELNLQTVARKLNMSPVSVSRIINSELNKNFRNLVNEYRIEEVKARFKDPSSSQFSILGVAYKCGFNSEASFYRIFKNLVGLSPKEYLQRK